METNVIAFVILMHGERLISTSTDILLPDIGTSTLRLTNVKFAPSGAVNFANKNIEIIKMLLEKFNPDTITSENFQPFVNWVETLITSLTLEQKTAILNKQLDIFSFPSPILGEQPYSFNVTKNTIHNSTVTDTYQYYNKLFSFEPVPELDEKAEAKNIVSEYIGMGIYMMSDCVLQYIEIPNSSYPQYLIHLYVLLFGRISGSIESCSSFI